ncbi:hypothetical protein [Bacillus toyonensis]|uniref:hypothetical protein n=1 Tax=Bacillus toyonensis TaxID=155322 RepID=UPI00352A611F
MPVNVYKIEGQKVTFTRSITNVEMKDFDQSSELDFRDQSVHNQKEFIHQLFGLTA